MALTNEIRRIPHKGRGVFAKRAYRAAELIEKAPVIPLEAKHWPAIRRTVLADHVFEWGRTRMALALGQGSLYNHSEHPNAHGEPRLRDGVIEFRAARPIEKGEEITIDYRGDETERSVWFKAK
jgi:SET domain-containing protein